MTNVKHLRDILSKFELEDTTEAIEFLDAIEEDIADAEDKIKSLEEDKSNLESEVRELEDNPSEESAFVGLDTFYWRLEKGNLKVQMQVERFIEALQKQNAVVPA